MTNWLYLTAHHSVWLPSGLEREAARSTARSIQIRRNSRYTIHLLLTANCTAHHARLIKGLLGLHGKLVAGLLQGQFVPTNDLVIMGRLGHD